MDAVLDVCNKLTLNFFEIYIILLFLDMVFESKIIDKHVREIIFCVKFVLTLSVDYYVPYVWVNFIASMVSVFLLSCCYRAPLWKKIVVSIEPRVFSKTGVGVSLPAGYVEDGESYIEAAKRELLEETGYVSDMLIPLGGFYQDIGCSSAFNESIVALGCIATNVQHLDESEFVKYVECSSEEIDYLLNNNYIVDGNAILTLLKGRKYIK